MDPKANSPKTEDDTTMNQWVVIESEVPELELEKKTKLIDSTVDKSEAEETDSEAIIKRYGNRKYTTDKENDRDDMYTRNDIRQHKYLDDDENIDDRANISDGNEDFDEDFDKRANMCHDVANQKVSQRFRNLFKDLVMEYQKPVKKGHIRRPLENKEVLKIVLDQLDLLNIIHKESVEDDPAKFTIYPYDPEHDGSMSEAGKLQKQEKIKKFVDSERPHSRRKLRDYKIDNLKSETDKTSECEKTAKPSTSSTQEEITFSVDVLFSKIKSDKFPRFKRFIESLNDNKLNCIKRLLRELVFDIFEDKLTVSK
ncbi:uncharacterized protein LOC109856428 [Pseudomyrmex gracilis]|uniref:uncharacterized protein LOC109856428 n=1 Tax=Pseudomyrmex gracilis TaxID=219809 RepID=UPI000995442B|nr:uncharacterized protein LOC109856428 [Pseudomyrmex gracilis]